MCARLHRIPEAAELLGFSTRQTYRWIRAGRLRAVRVKPGSPWRIPDDALAEFIESLEDNQPTGRIRLAG